MTTLYTYNTIKVMLVYFDAIECTHNSLNPIFRILIWSSIWSIVCTHFKLLYLVFKHQLHPSKIPCNIYQSASHNYNWCVKRQQQNDNKMQTIVSSTVHCWSISQINPVHFHQHLCHPYTFSPSLHLTYMRQCLMMCGSPVNSIWL